MLSEIRLAPTEQKRAVAILLPNLATMDDWIATNLTLDALATFVRQHTFDRQQFVALMKTDQRSRHKSAVSRAGMFSNLVRVALGIRAR